MSRVTRIFAATLALCAFIVSGLPTAATPIATQPFQKVWMRTDSPVKNHVVNRTWMWGPEADSVALWEDYAQSPGGKREVQYFDKSRMEVNDPSADQAADWYVTNGLLAEEMITGKVQLGATEFVTKSPAQVNVAGDSNDPNGPTYASFSSLVGYGAIPAGWKITQTVDRAGNVGNDSSLGSYDVTATDVGAPTHHTVASVFWSFMNSSGIIDTDSGTQDAKLFPNPFYATGYPLTEAYWTHVLVGGAQKLVLVQVFERRVLTYTPSNPDGWQVEAGNVGQHYYAWRYGQLGFTPSPVQAPTPTPTPTPTPPDQPTYVQTNVLAYPLDFDPAIAFPALDPQGRIWVAGLNTTTHPALLRYDGFTLAGDWYWNWTSAFLGLDAVHAPYLFTIKVSPTGVDNLYLYAVDVLVEVDSQHITLASEWFPDIPVDDLATDAAKNVYVIGSSGTLEKYTSTGQKYFTRLNPGGLTTILGVYADQSNHVYLVGSEATASGTIGKLVELDTAGNVITSWTTPNVYNFVRTDAAGNFYVGRFKGTEVDKYDATGKAITRIGAGNLTELLSFDVSDSGSVVAADPNGIHLFRVSP
jgi:hypothetical protein